MFNFLKSKKPFIPLDSEARKYFEDNFLWLMGEFSEPGINERRILVPTNEDFPIKWESNEENALEVLDILCSNMQIEKGEVDLGFHDNGLKEINMGGSVLFIESDGSEAAGLYYQKNNKGKYEISIDAALLSKPDVLIATMAHELCHLKLLGEKQLPDNDEMLTDFATVFFGLGIFNANAAFHFHQEVDRWGASNMGYLKVEEWGYALALLAFIRDEPHEVWSQYLSKTIKIEFDKCYSYIIENRIDIWK